MFPRSYFAGGYFAPRFFPGPAVAQGARVMKLLAIRVGTRLLAVFSNVPS